MPNNRPIQTAGLLLAAVLAAWLLAGVLPAASQGPGTLWPGLSVGGDSGPVFPGGETTLALKMLNAASDTIASTYLTYVLPPGFTYTPGSAGVVLAGRTLTQTEPFSSGRTLTWGSFDLPAATVPNNPFGVHTFAQDLCAVQFVDLQLNQALTLAGQGGYVTELFYPIDAATPGPSACAVYFVNRAYDLGLVPIVRLQGHFVQVNPNLSWWQKPDPGPNGDYAAVAAAFARYTAGLPRRDGHLLYVTIWNEPNVWVEWSGAPNPDEYARFFVAVSNAIRALNDPRIKIMNGPTSPPHDPTPDFIRAMFNVPGFATAFDVWGSHVYPLNHPAWYNIHSGAAKYPEASIDSYLIEGDILAEYGRTNVQYILKETGYGLGSNEYGFEGFPPINDANRTQYITAAFDRYWRTWPEVLAVTPFELGDPWSGWEWLDWIDYTVPNNDPAQIQYIPYPQYNAVAALPKPQLNAIPNGVEITFRARAAADLPPGTRTGFLYGLVGGGGTGSLGTGSLAYPLPVTVSVRLSQLYLPVIGKNWISAPPVTGTGLLAASAGPTFSPAVGGATNGAIVPTAFLTGTRAAWVQTGPAPVPLFPPLEPLALAVDGPAGQAYLAAADGRLLVVSLNGQRPAREIRLDVALNALVAGSKADTLYGATQSGHLLLIDAAAGAVTARAAGAGRVRGMAVDPASGDLLLADALSGAVVRYAADLSARRDSHIPRPGDSPDRLLCDPARRRLVITFPGTGRVLALNAATWQTEAETRLVGGPIVAAAFDAAGERLYLLSALTPNYRGLFVLNGDDLSFAELAAGSSTFPLRRAPAMSAGGDGRLWVFEGDALYLIEVSGSRFEVTRAARLPGGRRAGLFAADPASRTAVWVGGDAAAVYTLR
ncbi:MAG: YncE family protein [Anaerolineae bacterium]